MSDFPANALVPREEGALTIAKMFAAIRDTEAERQFGNKILFISGWLVSFMILIPFVYTLLILKNRPVPQDRIFVSMLRADGTPPTMAKPVEDMTETERLNAKMQFAYDYVYYRMSYDWKNAQSYYDRTRFLSAGEAQKDYTKESLESPNRTTVVLGQTGEREVAIKTPYMNGPMAVSVPFNIRIKTKEGIWTPWIERIAHFSFDVQPAMPASVAQRMDPLKLVTTHWTDDPATFDPTKPGGAH